MSHIHASLLTACTSPLAWAAARNKAHLAGNHIAPLKQTRQHNANHKAHLAELNGRGLCDHCTMAQQLWDSPVDLGWGVKHAHLTKLTPPGREPQCASLGHWSGLGQGRRPCRHRIHIGQTHVPQLTAQVEAVMPVCASARRRY